MKHIRKISIAVALLLAVSAAFFWFYSQGRLFGSDNTKDIAAKHGSAQVYTCPMHPFILNEKPGSCPICGMDLVKKAPATEHDQHQQVENLAHIALSSSQRVMANVAVTEAKEQVLTREVQIAGLVQYDQARQAKVTAWVAGRVDTLYADTVGSLVSKKHPVAELYSPELFAGQQEYLLALANLEKVTTVGQPDTLRHSAKELLMAARQRLLLFGMSGQQLAQLEQTRAASVRLPVYTPLSGVVVEKLVQKGQYLNIGDPLFSIADLSTVWVELEIYENDLAGIRLGQQVEIRAAFLPQKIFTGKISFIYPFLDPQTRTVKARVAVYNPDLLLKPEMFVDVQVSVQSGKAVTIPLSALLDTGRQQTVWVETEPDLFVPRNVQTGQRNHEFVQILSGIKPGERVAVSGAYLIDSESRLQGGMQHNQSTHKDDDLSMDDLEM